MECCGQIGHLRQHAQHSAWPAQTLAECYRAFPPTTTGNLRLLLDTIGAAGVRIGAYDVQVLEWLAKQPPATCAMIASLIAQAAEPVAGFMPMGTSDIDPETGEEYGSDD